MKLSKLLFAIFFVAFLAGCEKDDKAPQSTSNTNTTTPTTTDCQTDASKRRGAKCKDGTESSATGSGACSGHGGVDHWLCK